MNGRVSAQLLVFILEFFIPFVAIIGYPYALSVFGSYLLEVCREQKKTYKFFKSRLRAAYFAVSMVYSMPFILTLAWAFSTPTWHSDTAVKSLVVTVFRSVTGLYCSAFLLYQIPVWIVCTLIFRSIFLGGKLAKWLPWVKSE